MAKINKLFWLFSQHFSVAASITNKMA